VVNYLWWLWWLWRWTSCRCTGILYHFIFVFELSGAEELELDLFHFRLQSLIFYQYLAFQRAWRRERTSRLELEIRYTFAYMINLSWLLNAIDASLTHRIIF